MTISIAYLNDKLARKSAKLQAAYNRIDQLERELAAVTAENKALREVVLDCRDEFEYIKDRGGIPLWVHSACKVRIAAIDAVKGGSHD